MRFGEKTGTFHMSGTTLALGTLLMDLAQPDLTPPPAPDLVEWPPETVDEQQVRLLTVYGERICAQLMVLTTEIQALHSVHRQVLQVLLTPLPAPRPAWWQSLWQWLRRTWMRRMGPRA